MMSKELDLAPDITIYSEDHEDTTWIQCTEELALTSFTRFKHLRDIGHMTDVQIEVQGKDGKMESFRAHKVVLAATIPFFYSMFTTEMVEARADSVKLPNIDAETMDIILNFAYEGRIKFTSKNIEKLLKASDYLQLTTLSNRCAEILKTRINERNVFSIRRFALLYNVPQAVVDADFYTQRHFNTVSKSEEFAQLEFTTILQILNWDQLHVDSEERVFEAVIHWLEFDVSSRQVFAPKLLTAVRMPLLRPSYLIDEVSRNPLIWNSLECRDLIDEAKNFHLIPERRHNFNTIFNTTIRVCTEMPGVIYALGGINQLQPSPSAMEIYDPAIKRWHVTKSMMSQRTRIGVAVSDGKIYVVGGYNGVERLRCAEVYDVRTSSWSMLPQLNKRRSAMCAAALGEHIFVIGGYDGTSALDSVEAYEIKHNRWVMKPSMLSKRCAAGIAVVRGLIYVIGGHNGLQIFNTVECYDPVVERWTTVSPMLQPRCRLSATAYLNKIYVVGGYHDSSFLRSAEVYDPQTDCWTQIAPMNLSRARVSLVTNGNSLYAIGGYDGENNLNTMEVYNPAKNHWENGARLIAHEGGVGAVVVPNPQKSKDKEKCRNNLKRPYNDFGNPNAFGEGPSSMAVRKESEQME